MQSLKAILLAADEEAREPSWVSEHRRIIAVVKLSVSEQYPREEASVALLPQFRVVPPIFEVLISLTV